MVSSSRPIHKKGLLFMNKHDKEFLSLNWELMKEKAKRLGPVKFYLDISSGCYVEFGTYGISVNKYRNKRWYRKIVNGWKELTFDEFTVKFGQTEWEKIP